MMIYLETLLYQESSNVSNTLNVYEAFNFRKIKHLFMVSARFCEIYFTLQVLPQLMLHTFNYMNKLEPLYINHIPIRSELPGSHVFLSLLQSFVLVIQLFLETLDQQVEGGVNQSWPQGRGAGILVLAGKLVL